MLAEPFEELSLINSFNKTVVKFTVSVIFLFQPHLWVILEGTYILKWAFLLIQFCGGYIHRREMRVVSIKNLSSVEFKINFFRISFFKDLSRFKILCEQEIFGLILFTFRVIFVQIKIFSIEKVIQNYISRYKKNQFRVFNRRRSIKILVFKVSK